MLQKTIVILFVLCCSTALFAQSKKSVSSRPRPVISASTTSPSSSKDFAMNSVVYTVVRPTQNHVDFVPLDFGTVFAGMSVEKTIDFKGATVGREVGLNVPRGAQVDGSFFLAWVSAPDKVTIRYTNNSTTPQNPGGEQVFRIRMK